MILCLFHMILEENTNSSLFFFDHEPGYISSSHSVQYTHLTILSDERLTRGEKIVHIGGGHPKDTDQLMSTELRCCRQADIQIERWGILEVWSLSSGTRLSSSLISSRGMKWLKFTSNPSLLNWMCVTWCCIVRKDSSRRWNTSKSLMNVACVKGSKWSLCNKEGNL